MIIEKIIIQDRSVKFQLIILRSKQLIRFGKVAAINKTEGPKIREQKGNICKQHKKLSIVSTRKRQTKQHFIKLVRRVVS